MDLGEGVDGFLQRVLDGVGFGTGLGVLFALFALFELRDVIHQFFDANGDGRELRGDARRSRDFDGGEGGGRGRRESEVEAVDDHGGGHTTFRRGAREVVEGKKPGRRADQPPGRNLPILESWPDRLLVIEASDGEGGAGRGFHHLVEHAAIGGVGDALFGGLFAEDGGAQLGPIDEGHDEGAFLGFGVLGVGEEGVAGEPFGLEGAEFGHGAVVGALDAALVEFDAVEGGGLFVVERIDGGREGGGAAEVPGGEDELVEEVLFGHAPGAELEFKFITHFFECGAFIVGEMEFASGEAMGEGVRSGTSFPFNGFGSS